VNGVLGMILGSKYRTSGGGPGCLGYRLGVIYLPTSWGTKEPQNLPNHRVAGKELLVGDPTFEEFECFILKDW